MTWPYKKKRTASPVAEFAIESNEILTFFQEHYEKHPDHTRSQSRLVCITCGASPLLEDFGIDNDVRVKNRTESMQKMIALLCTEKHCTEPKLLELLVIDEFDRRLKNKTPLRNMKPPMIREEGKPTTLLGNTIRRIENLTELIEEHEGKGESCAVCSDNLRTTIDTLPKGIHILVRGKCKIVAGDKLLTCESPHSPRR